MSANTETTGADRTGCKAWCGTYKLHESGIQRYWSTELSCMGDGAPTHWCSLDCRDARMPPIAAPAAHKIEVKATVDGKCPLCGVAVPSTHIHVCGGSLRQAAPAPAAHVERRKGQRWKFRNQHAAHFDATIVERKGLGWKVTDVVDHDGSGKSRAFSDVFWEEPNYYTMTLLADAPPEPAECWCGGPLTGETLCSTHAAEAAKCESPPAQEAPKAAPLPFSFTDQEGRVHRFATGNERDAASRAYWSWMAEQTGKPYAGPERLPRPQLAADWVEDCLPEAGR